MLVTESFAFIRFGTYGLDDAIKAGLDLEMPGWSFHSS